MSQVACIAVVGPDNNPILIRKYCDEQQEMELDSLLFCSLDHFDPQSNQKKSGSKERFFSISTSDRFQIWGYRAALQYKIIVLTLNGANIQDAAMKSICEKTRDVLFDAIMDPFYSPFAMIEAGDVVKRIDDIAATLTATPV